MIESRKNERQPTATATVAAAAIPVIGNNHFAAAFEKYQFVRVNKSPVVS